MNEPGTPAPQQHHAPEGWKPLSGLALIAFVGSLVLSVVAMFGPWIVLALPLVLGVVALLRFDPAKQRGRALAVWAIVVAIGAGGFTYAIHQSGRVLFSRIGESFLSALSSESAPEKRDEALRAWTSSEAIEKDPKLFETWRARYATTVETMGDWTGELRMPSMLKGIMPIFTAPEGVKEIGTNELPPTWAPGSVFWVPAVFEKGTVFLALVVGEGDAAAVKKVQDELKGTDPVPLFGDLRFFRDAP